MNISLSWLKKVNGFTAQWVITVFVVGLMIGVLIGGAGVLSPPHIAAWVQAFGTIAAVLFAGWIATWQVKKNHKLAMQRLKYERRVNVKALAHSLYRTVEDCLDWMQRFVEDFDSIEKLRESKIDPRAIRAADFTTENLKSIRFHNLPPDIVEPMITVCNIFPVFMIVTKDTYEKSQSIEGMELERRCDDLNGFIEHTKAACNRLKELAEIK